MGKQLGMGFVALKKGKKKQLIRQKVNADWKPTENNWQTNFFAGIWAFSY